MNEIKIIKVTNKKDLKKFIEFPFSLYKADPFWVPPLKGDMYNMFNEKKNPFLDHGTIQPFIAIINGKVVGRVCAIIDRNFIEFHGEKTGYFGFFESIDNTSVAKGLLKRAEEFLKEHDLERLIGPMNPSTNDECGMLLEGYDDSPRIMMTYNFPYYHRLMEECGYGKSKDLFAFHMDIREGPPEKLSKFTKRIKERRNIKIQHINMKNFKEELEKVKAVYNSAWEKNWGFVPMTDAELDHMAKDLKPLVIGDLVQFAEIDGEIVGFMWTMPDYNHVLKKMNGKMNIFKFLKHKKGIKWARLITLGIKEGYRKQGIDALFFDDAFKTAEKLGYTHAEFSWVLEENVLVHRAAKFMNGELYKKYRIYGKEFK